MNDTSYEEAINIIKEGIYDNKVIYLVLSTGRRQVLEARVLMEIYNEDRYLHLSDEMIHRFVLINYEYLTYWLLKVLIKNNQLDQINKIISHLYGVQIEDIIGKFIGEYSRLTIETIREEFLIILQSTEKYIKLSDQTLRNIRKDIGPIWDNLDQYIIDDCTLYVFFRVINEENIKKLSSYSIYNLGYMAVAINLQSPFRDFLFSKLTDHDRYRLNTHINDGDIQLNKPEGYVSFFFDEV